MQLDAHLASLARELAHATALADQETRSVVERLAPTLDASLRLMLLEVLVEAAAEVSAQLGDEQVSVRMVGREPELVLDRSIVAPPAPAGPVEEDETTSRITLRLPEGVKSRAEAAAQAQGTSLNSWITEACRQALEPQKNSHRGQRRITGWA
ncbi:toxin-antitoxin system HicB family antitoxin [Luteococcus peritonei]|uniref:Toxin-antitoxin system HicB family antitoxin n=1 Tax=Luteococcus peritonei TaxID=88874 RepID=A0ABW4RWR9_9ACTN